MRESTKWTDGMDGKKKFRCSRRVGTFCSSISRLCSIEIGLAAHEVSKRLKEGSTLVPIESGRAARELEIRR